MVTSGMGALPLWIAGSLAPPPRACHPAHSDQQAPLVDQQPGLGLEAALAAIAAELAAAREDTVAGNDDRQRIAAAGLADLLWHAAGFLGDLAVASGLAIGDALHRLPDLMLERRALRPQRQIEVAQLAREVGADLARGFLEERRRGLAARLLPAHPDEHAVLLLDAQGTDGAGFEDGDFGHVTSQSVF